MAKQLHVEGSQHAFQSSPTPKAAKEELKGIAGVRNALIGFVANVFVGTVQQLEEQGFKLDDSAKAALMQLIAKSAEDGMTALATSLEKGGTVDKTALQAAFLAGMKHVFDELQKKANEMDNR